MPNWAGIVNNVQKQSSTLASTSVVLFALIGNRNECARKLPGRVLAHPYTHSAAIKYVGGSGFREEKVKGEGEGAQPRQHPHRSSPNLCISDKTTDKGTHGKEDMAEAPQMVRPYARFLGASMSVIVAPPVARTGDPTKPVINRNTKSLPKLVASAVGT